MRLKRIKLVCRSELMDTADDLKADEDIEEGKKRMDEEKKREEEAEIEDEAGEHGDGRAIHRLPARFLLPQQYRPSIATTTILHDVPIIDLSSLREAADEDMASRKAHALSQIHSACRNWGFFQVLNHGVSLHNLHSLHQGFLHFLNLPLPDKRSCTGFVQGDNGQGYGSAFVNPQIGTTEWREYLVFATFPESARTDSQWPPAIRDFMGTFSAEVLLLATRLLAAFSENLHLPASYIEEAMEGLNQKVLISHYPPCPEPDKAVGACEHTDVGALTFVWQASEDVAGLQVYKDGKWHTIPPIHGALVVNVADQVEILSNGLYKSGRHRVVLDSSKPRISVVAFHNPSPSAEIFPAASLIDHHHPPAFEATRFKSYAAKFGIKSDYTSAN